MGALSWMLYPSLDISAMQGGICIQRHRIFRRLNKSLTSVCPIWLIHLFVRQPKWGKPLDDFVLSDADLLCSEQIYFASSKKANTKYMLSWFIWGIRSELGLDSTVRWRFSNWFWGSWKRNQHIRWKPQCIPSSICTFNSPLLRHRHLCSSILCFSRTTWRHRAASSMRDGFFDAISIGMSRCIKHISSCEASHRNIAVAVRRRRHWGCATWKRPHLLLLYHIYIYIQPLYMCILDMAQMVGVCAFGGFVPTLANSVNWIRLWQHWWCGSTSTASLSSNYKQFVFDVVLDTKHTSPLTASHIVLTSHMLLRNQ